MSAALHATPPRGSLPPELAGPAGRGGPALAFDRVSLTLGQTAILQGVDLRAFIQDVSRATGSTFRLTSHSTPSTPRLPASRRDTS